MLFLEVENLEFPGGHIEIMLFIEMKKKRIDRRPYWTMLIIEIAKIELMAAILELCFL